MLNKAIVTLMNVYVFVYIENVYIKTDSNDK